MSLIKKLEKILPEKIVDFLNVNLLGMHKHEYKLVDGVIAAEDSKVKVTWKQYECSGCTKTIVKYRGRKSETDKYETIDSLLENRYLLK